jgi:tetratricopeptide (TPR) repeat protein
VVDNNKGDFHKFLKLPNQQDERRGIASNSTQPSETRAWKKEGDVLYFKGRYEEAMQCYDKALEIDPSDVDAWRNKGVALSGLGRYADALACFDRALEIMPPYILAWYSKGAALNGLGRYADALACFNIALETMPTLHKAWSKKGIALGGLGRREDAMQCYDKALEIDPSDVDAWRNKGTALDALGRREEAIQCYDKALQIKPHSDEERKGWMLAAKAKSHLPDPSNVEDYVLRCLEPGFIEQNEKEGSRYREAEWKSVLLTDMGETEWKSGDIQAAVYWWSQAVHCLSFDPVDNKAYLYLASVAAGLGFHDLMRSLYACADFSLKKHYIRQKRLIPEEKNALEALVRNNKTQALQKALRGLQAKYSFQ